MKKSEKTGAAPVSKYAAKKAKLAAEALEERAGIETSVETSIEPCVESKAETVDKTVKAKNTSTKKGALPASASNYSEHIVAIALIIKNNAEIRRFTALGILNYLLQKGDIKGDNRYVSFKWNKFVVKCGGLTREYFYTEPFFMNALVASFSSFSASAQRTIDTFCRKEMGVDISRAADQSEIDNIVELNDKYQAEKA